MDGNQKLSQKKSYHFSQIASNPPKGAIGQSHDNFMDLMQAFEGFQTGITNIYIMEDKDLSAAKLSQPFWSSHSLPLYKGGSANRFSHEEFSSLKSWTERYQSYLNNPVESFIRNETTQELSPLEKYELIIGSDDFSLTAREWEKGQESIDINGNIPTWIGACHGTAPSSLIHPRPKKAISILSANGKTSVLFYPTDIKALLAFAWTTNGGPSAVMGNRCQYTNKNIKSCNDTNPGSFHLALTNLIGLHQKPIIIDTDSGAQVWNRPVVSYRFTYFNPQFRNYTRKVANAIIDINKYQNDPYKKFRAAGTKSIVGVRAEIELINDTTTSSELFDSNITDSHFNLVFVYDLELDQDGEILGGMWHQPNFPDFVWVVSNKNIPLSNRERWLERLTTIRTGPGQLPEVLKGVGEESRKDQQISYWVVDYLLRKSIADE